MPIKTSPWIRENFTKLQKACAEQGITIKLTEGVRDPATQSAYYAQGREPLAVVNRLRKEAGLVPIDDKTNRRVITWKLHSSHIFGFAFDIVLLKEGKAVWEDDETYQKIADIGVGLGLHAGHYFTNKAGKRLYDSCHFERKL